METCVTSKSTLWNCMAQSNQLNRCQVAQFTICDLYIYISNRHFWLVAAWNRVHGLTHLRCFMIARQEILRLSSCVQQPTLRLCFRNNQHAMLQKYRRIQSPPFLLFSLAVSTAASKPWHYVFEQARKWQSCMLVQRVRQCMDDLKTLSSSIFIQPPWNPDEKTM